jgi:hypothetical protein
MNLCSIRRTHYCSLAGQNISSWVDNGQGSEMRPAQRWRDGRQLHIQPDRHEPDPRALVGARHTERRHTRLHEGSISVGTSVCGGGAPGQRRRACQSQRARGGSGGRAMTAVEDVSNSVYYSLPRRMLRGGLR